MNLNPLEAADEAILVALMASDEVSENPTRPPTEILVNITHALRALLLGEQAEGGRRRNNPTGVGQLNGERSTMLSLLDGDDDTYLTKFRCTEATLRKPINQR